MKNKILKLKNAGKTYAEIASILGCSKSTVSYYCNESVRKKAIQDAKEYKNQKKSGEPLKSDSDIDCFCLQCNKLFLKKRVWSKTNRKFCDLSCEQNFKKNKFLIDWKLGLHPGFSNENTLKVSTFVREYIKSKYNNKCAYCGWFQINPFSGVCYLEIHHIDGKASNCKEENLILLCPNCHSLTENYKYLNDKSCRKICQDAQIRTEAL